MHIQELIQIGNQALTTLAMVAAWTTTKLDDQLVKLLQVTLNHSELMDIIIELLDQHEETNPLVNRGADASVPFNQIVKGEIADSHKSLAASATAFFDERLARGPNDPAAKAKEILKAQGIDWAKWLAMLPTIIQILMMFRK